MTASTATLALVAVLSAAFALVYLPLAARLVPAIASPYAKVDLRKRFASAGVDAFVALTGVVFWLTLHAPVLAFAAAVYVVLRDALFAPGQSVGKFLFGLHVVHVRTGRRCTRLRSIARNAIFVVPGLNLVALVFECARIVRDPQGDRLGDLLAGTQVVEGFGAREVVQEIQRDLTRAGDADGRRRRSLAQGN
jgi:uncharacterized RDD family membrane protein YckC